MKTFMGILSLIWGIIAIVYLIMGIIDGNMHYTIAGFVCICISYLVDIKNEWNDK